MADAQTNLPIWSRSTSDPVIVSADTAANDATNPIYISEWWFEVRYWGRY